VEKERYPAHEVTAYLAVPLPGCDWFPESTSFESR
jgi:hypothetical protein